MQEQSLNKKFKALADENFLPPLFLIIYLFCKKAI